MRPGYNRVDPAGERRWRWRVPPVAIISPRAAFGRKLVNGLVCGGGFGARAPTRKKRPIGAPSPPSEAGSERLSELLKAEMSPEEVQRAVERLREGDRGREAAAEVRRLAKDDPAARESLGRLGAIPFLVGMLSCVDVHLQVNPSTLSSISASPISSKHLLWNKAAIVSSGALHKMLALVGDGGAPPPVAAAVAANLLALSALDSNKPLIGSSAAIPFLLHTFRHAAGQPREDALRALFNLSIAAVNLPPSSPPASSPNSSTPPSTSTTRSSQSGTRRPLQRCLLAGGEGGGRPLAGGVPDPGGGSRLVRRPRCQELAAQILTVMAYKEYEARAAMAAEGIVSSLLELTLLGSDEAQKRASRILQFLIVGDKAKKPSAAVSAPLSKEEGRSPEEEEMSEERKAVKKLVKQSLQSNMRRISLPVWSAAELRGKPWLSLSSLP
ncbi:unnamed protein product [Spirodela intermedia]|uniref:Uncharacterized protein n=1 Tax=Spirodela intermedia TaxID=51605 RepID=A0A7I8IUW7_SPIIN|nr:unnamed protein product [Spirodela intermedia]CAA6661667.1 unnamed protein product [Spirodela intermedia]